MRRPTAKWLLLIPPLLFGLAYLDRVESGPVGDWRSASRAPVGLAPDPASRESRWFRSMPRVPFVGAATSACIPGSPSSARDAVEYTVYEVNGWRLRRTGSAVSVDHRSPDSRWFGSRPELLADRRGAGVDELITRIEAAVAAYPYAATYRVWPGPNSNTFVAHVLRAAPELRADLPATAIGKDYLGPGFVAWSPSGTGAQLNVFGVVGALAGVEEGVELNLLGLTFGVDPLDLSVKLPLAGRLGWPRAVRSAAVPANEG